MTSHLGIPQPSGLTHKTNPQNANDRNFKKGSADPDHQYLLEYLGDLHLRSAMNPTHTQNILI